MAQNKWIESLKQDNPGSTLNLTAKSLTQAQLKQIAKVIQAGTFTHIVLADAKPTNAILKDWIQAVRANDTITQIAYNQKGLDPKLTGELQNLLNTNRSINKLFGKGRLYMARNVPMFALFGYNFVHGAAMVIAPAHATVASVIGGLVLAGLRAASNYWFNRSIHQTKAKDYWNNQSSQQAFDYGRDCADQWSPWFHYKSWTTNGYLGYTQEKHKMDYTQEANPRQKPRA